MPPDVVIDGDTSDEPVVVVISGPVQVYKGVPAPPEEVVVSVITAPVQKGFVADDTSAEASGCAVKV